jgi:hypothetical protein
MPEQMLHAFQLFGYRCSGLLLARFALQRLGLLLQNRQPHRDVKPVYSVLAARLEIRLHPPHIFTSVRQEHHLLVLLQALRLHDFPQPPARLLVVGLHGAQVRRRSWGAKADLPSRSPYSRTTFQTMSSLIRPP